VYRSTTSGSYGAAIANVSSPTSTYVDSSAVPGTTYFYVVTAVDDDLNESIVSNEDSATPTEPNQIPVFDSDPLVKAAAEVNALYSGSLADDAGDGNDDPITFSLISGPEWLSVSTNGGLSGTPLSVGSVPNTWTIQVEDDRGGSSQTELRITVNADATAPAAPAGLAATPGNNQVTLDWNENGETDFDSYMVYRSVTTGSPYTQLQSGLTENSYTDETAENGTEYFYVVRAVDNAGNISSDSNEAPATPTAPTEVQVLATDNAYIRWSSPDTVFDVSEFFMADRNQFIYGAREAYIRFPLTGEDEMGGVSIENIESVTLELYSTNTSSHIIYVYAMLDGVQSEVSDQSESSWTGGTGGTGGNLTPNTRPFGKDAHLPVTNLSTVKLGEAQNVASGEVLQITITEMEVFRELIRNDTNGEITLVMNSSESGGDNFFASVYNSGGNPVPALRAGVTPPDVTPPAAPTGLAATPLDASVMLDWNDSLEEDFANYTVYRSTTEGTGHTELQAGLTGSEYLDDTAINGTEYFYVVRALDLTGNLSAASVEASAIPLPDPPAAPTNPDATGGRKSVSLSWTDASTTETGFIVQRSITSGSGFTTVTTTAADATSFIDTGLQAGTPYFYQVLATNTGGNSSPTQQVSATTWTEQEEYFDDSGISHDADPADDSDGDGISNEDEFIVQTDPDDPASTFTATVEAPAAGEDVAFTVPTASGRYYRVLYRNSLESGDWMVLEGYENIDSNVTNPVRVEDSLSDSSNRFYRVEVQMTPFSTP
jgi:fibronectin type 3 domain-containing protein